MKRLYIAISIVITISVIVCAFLIYERNKPVKYKTTYVMPERSDNVHVDSGIVAPRKPAPEPKIRKPVERKVVDEPEMNESDVFEEELKEFLDLVKAAGELEEEDEEKPFVLLDLTPDEMIEYLHENFRPDDYMDFLSSGTGLKWIKTKLAPNYPRLDDPFVTECGNMYPGRGDSYTDCVEDRYRILVADNRDAYVNGTRNVLDFIEKLNPTPSSGGGASGSIAPAVKPPEPRIR